MTLPVRAKVRFVGYLGRPAQPAISRRRVPLVLVTAGGGGDGFDLLQRYLGDLNAAYPHGDAPFRSLVVAGPFMSGANLAALKTLAAAASRRRRATVKSFVPDLSRTLAGADAVVAMAGYNTTCEVLAFSRPALLVPRVRPREEQLIRARALARRGLVRMLHPDAIGPGEILAEVHQMLASPARPHCPVDQEGLANAAHELELLLDPPASSAVAGTSIRS